MNRCPKCDGKIIVFNDHNQPHDSPDSLSINCQDSKCGYVLTFAGLLNHAEVILRHVEMWPDSCAEIGLRMTINDMKKTISEGMER